MTRRLIGRNADRETIKAFLQLFFLLLVASGEAASAGDLAGVPANTQKTGEPKRQIAISIPDRKLVLMEDSRVVRIYSVATGASVSPSPTGSFQLVSKVADPTYYHSGKVIPPGRSNPLGDRWIGLSKKGYGIHGTNVPSSVGKAASHGCFRMGKRDVEELFELVRVGDEVEIHGDRDARIRDLFGDGTQIADEPGRPAAKPAVSTVAMAVAASAL